MKHIYFTVTNDLSYDQRMHRICTSLAQNGFTITLVGRKLKTSIALQQRPFVQKRIQCFFNKSFLFYAEYNLRLFFFLSMKKMDAICAIDLDTILPCLAISKIKKVPRIYDAHEYFTELKEVRTRPFVKEIWGRIERYAVPKFSLGYTVSEGLAQAFKETYGRQYTVIRNLPKLIPAVPLLQPGKFILYQGAVNEGRCFEYLIPSMKMIKYPLVICGDGNFMQQLKELIAANGVSGKVELKGMLLPEDLRTIAQKASLGIGLAEKEGINQFHALPNKFLEYMHAGLPQIAMNFPEYKKINDRYKIAVLLDELSVDIVAASINATMENESLLIEMKSNAITAREVYNWEAEEKILLQFYQHLFS
ncbi:MAG: glycosyltransferase family 4 protein [Flavisolibacter sp.]|nr:glycosyltransferase family 4 protein [Flavisolibacter sp.]